MILLLLEFVIRIIIFFPTNLNVFKYGFKKSVSFEAVDLGKFQISVFDNDQKIKKINLKNSSDIFWVFGGSTTYGYNCENNQSSSWPEEIYKINNNFKFKNFSFNGANTDLQIVLLKKEILKKRPKVILWANKFNTIRMLGLNNDYRNKNILNYEFSNSDKINFYVTVKQIDKTLKSYLISYSLLDKIIVRINLKLGLTKEIIKPTKEDMYFALKNFELNTIEAIETSINYGVEEFFIISLFHDDKNYNELEKYRFKLYKEIIFSLSEKYNSYVKIIDLDDVSKNFKQSELLCDTVHQTLKGNVLQSKIINNQLINKSNFLND